MRASDPLWPQSVLHQNDLHREEDAIRIGDEDAAALEYPPHAVSVQNGVWCRSMHRGHGTEWNKSPSPLGSSPFSDDSQQESLSASMEVDTSEAAAATPPKQSRYLREIDRHHILQRIQSGEKQVALAREYGVTRAAISHINKNRKVILARSARPDVFAAARHPKRSHPSGQPSRKTTNHSAETIHQVQSLALSALLAALRSEQPLSDGYRAVADRAFRLLLEEALALLWTRSDRKAISSEFPVCAMTISEGGYPMLHTFRQIQPHTATGSITLGRDTSGDLYGKRSAQRVVVHKICAPVDLTSRHVVVLAPTCGSGDEASVAIQSLTGLGVDESAITFVTLAINAPTSAELCRQFPGLHVVAGTVDSDATGADANDFHERYFNTTTLRTWEELESKHNQW